MKLKDYIIQKGVVLGSTDDGKAWALKALHPADPMTEVRGIPDQSAVPSVFQNFQQTLNIPNPSAGTAGIWEADLFLFAHPVLLGALRTYSSAGAYLWSPIVNTQLGTTGDQWYTREQAFADNVERYRIAYMGATVHLDAAAISDQGMVAVAQYPLPCILGAADSNSTLLTRVHEIYNEAPKSWDQLVTLPNAYVSKAKDGAYVPYKLSYTHQVWRNARDTRRYIPYGNGSAMTSQAATCAWPAAAPSLVTQNGGFPYGIAGDYTGASPVAGTVVLQRADEGIVHLAFRNMHYQSALTVVLRSGYELQVAPASNLTPFAKISPRHDALAVDGYFAVSREFKDAYPEDYNGWEKILGVIGNAVSSVVENVVPGGKFLVGGAKALGKMIAPNLFTEDVTKMSAAQKEEAQELAKTTAVATPRTSKPQLKIVKKPKLLIRK